MTEIILGPPGTGKTTSLIEIVEEELSRGTPPDRIGYLSFTKKAATEALDRARVKFNLSRAQLPYFTTLHALCYRQLGLRSGDVLEGAAMQKFAAYAGVRISNRHSEDGMLSSLDPTDRALFMENLARIRCMPLQQLYNQENDDLRWSEVQRLSKALAAYKAANSLLDYTDMLSEFLRSESNLRLEVLLIDESQDLSNLQWKVVEKLAATCRRLIVSGDDDQCIYRWAGADADRLIDMEGSVRVLGQSWRVPPLVQDIAARIINTVKKRREKQWNARTGGEGSIVRASTFNYVEVDDVWREGSEMPPVLILARNAYILKMQVEPELRHRGVIYEKHGHPSISTGLMEVVRDWEALRRREAVPAMGVRKIFEWMTYNKGYKKGHKLLPGIEDEQMLTMEELRSSGKLLRDDPWYDALDKASDETTYIRAALKRGEKLRRRPRIVISTIHGSKGGEADHVILLREMAPRTWNEYHLRPEDEARVFYVGCTRAREKLTIVDSSTNKKYPL